MMFNHADLGRRTRVEFFYVPVEWTVFFGQRDAGNIRPVVGWKEKELKVGRISDAAALEKNEPTALRESGTFKTAEVQQCYFVTVKAESSEEASLVVDRFLSQGLGNSFGTGTLTETQGGGGPSVKAFVNSGGKAAAVLTSNIKEDVVR